MKWASFWGYTAVKHLHLCVGDVKGLLGAVADFVHVELKVSNKSPSSLLWMHLRGSIRLGARNGLPKWWRGHYLRYEGRGEMGKPHGLPQVDQVALFFYQICHHCRLPLLILDTVKKKNETPFCLASCPLEVGIRKLLFACSKGAQMDVRTTISDSISLPAPLLSFLGTFGLALAPQQSSSSSKEVDIKMMHSGWKFPEMSHFWRCTSQSQNITFSWFFTSLVFTV